MTRSSAATRSAPLSGCSGKPAPRAVHVKISSPPVKWPCFYGIDFASRAELIANGATIEEISQAIGADSLAYISEDGMIDATRQPRERLCTACFTGKYPIELPGSDKLGKNLLERTDLGGLPSPCC